MKLYIYDHCPYCVKARMIFGLKYLPFELVCLLNDDVGTPTRMIGQKMVPILERDDGSYLPESMDIIHEIDATHGQKILTGDSRAEIADWLSGTDEYLYKLAMPRWVKAPLEEFETEGARQFFTQKKEAMIGPFEENLSQSNAFIAKANVHLETLAELFKAPEAVNGELSEDDIHLFAALRSLSIVRGVHYPQIVEAYRQHMSAATEIPLHDGIAI